VATHHRAPSQYTKVTQPILTPAEHAVTKAAIDEFGKGVGQLLHKDLVAWDAKNNHTSYISGTHPTHPQTTNEWSPRPSKKKGMWFDMYLSDRVPLPINYNPQVTPLSVVRRI